MRITCLVDNCVERGSALWGAHGLSFLIETEGGNVLYDVGPELVVLEHNLRALGLEDTEIAALALSHAHADHTGALAGALDLYPAAPVYANPGLLEPRYSVRGGELQGAGMQDQALVERLGPRLRASREPQEIVPGLRTTGVVCPRPFPPGISQHHRVRRDGELVQDPYDDDMSLVLDVGDGIALVCGCCHAGLRNTLALLRSQDVRPLVAIVGGTHLMVASDAELEQLVEALRAETMPRLYLNHCTGERALGVLQRAFGEQVVACPAGTVIDLG